MKQTSRIAVAEAIGTLILIVGGPGSAILATGTFSKGPGASIGTLGVSLAFGLSLLCAAYAIGSPSRGMEPLDSRSPSSKRSRSAWPACAIAISRAGNSVAAASARAAASA